MLFGNQLALSSLSRLLNKIELYLLKITVHALLVNDNVPLKTCLLFQLLLANKSLLCEYTLCLMIESHTILKIGKSWLTLGNLFNSSEFYPDISIPAVKVPLKDYDL